MCYCTVYFSVGEFKTYPQKNSSTGTQTNVICFEEYCYYLRVNGLGYHWLRHTTTTLQHQPLAAELASPMPQKINEF
jgi:hypothetical protein